MLFVIIIGIVLLISLGFLIIPAFGFDYKSIYKYDPDGKQTCCFYRAQFPNKETEDKVALALKTEYAKGNKLKSKPQDLDNKVICYESVPCKEIVKKKLEWNGLPEIDEGFGVIALIGFCIVVVGALCCGGFAIGAHCTAAKAHARVNYERKIDELELKQQNLYNTLSGITENNIETTSTAYIVYDMGSITLAINDYNAEVIDFKEDLYHTKLLSENPWTNWYVCPVFKEVKGYNKYATNYKDILGETLKTFMPKEKM